MIGLEVDVKQVCFLLTTLSTEANQKSEEVQHLGRIQHLYRKKHLPRLMHERLRRNTHQSTRAERITGSSGTGCPCACRVTAGPVLYLAIITLTNSS